MISTAAIRPIASNQAVLEELLGGSLRNIRLERGERLLDVAQAAGCSVELVCSYEQGRAVPSIRRLAALLAWKAAGTAAPVYPPQ
jgi:transcriptional regulator with XRE-family HTH domain